jgi:hypothetical protein
MDLFRKPIVVRKLVIIAHHKTGRTGIYGDGDPRWIFVCLPKKILHMAIL